MKATNKFLLIIISCAMAMGLFCFVQYNANQLVNKSINAFQQANCKCECQD